jgi:hypothetical protein
MADADSTTPLSSNECREPVLEDLAALCQALMKSGCGIMYAEANRDATWQEVQGVRIPFASPETLWRMKQTPREKDIPDRLFLRKLLEARGVQLAPPDNAGLPGWLQRLKQFLAAGTRKP